jgi:catechol 2,3-dioxygenase-like lactoylglutathione lyase family enzyme
MKQQLANTMDTGVTRQRCAIIGTAASQPPTPLTRRLEAATPSTRGPTHWLALLTFLLLTFTASAQRVLEVGPIGLTVANLDRQLAFFTNALAFELESVTTHSGPALDRLYALDGVRVRQATLRLGDERVTLTGHADRAGRPIPADSRSFDHWFQHIAIVVSDMDRAYAHLQRHKVKHVSTRPQTLPDWNPDAGGIKAFYFRDPEDHVLEVIWFPPGKGDARWQRPGGRLFLGIDHTAIVVSDTERSLAFYRDALGMRIAGESENHGIEQERLNQVFGARLRITALRAPNGPGIEFLEYITPPGGHPLWPDARADDLAFWTVNARVHAGDATLAKVTAAGGTVLSRTGPAPPVSVLVRDPDGHALLLEPVRANSASAGP